MTQPVSFEISKLLKEKGFNEPVTKSYRISVNPKKELPTEPITDEITYFSNVRESIPAPTIAEVVMWFYTKHNIWIKVDVEQYPDGNNWLWQIVDLAAINKFTLVYGDDGDYNSPEEAYEAAIKHVLNELI